ncbi:hypothetical protein MA16_Dca004155 [Dendrobium catenatum]|uniref:PATROL1-like C-terminal domain-containing protein n=1 Tax=Dendrobium catenatum TaxID=906689 RepID=A0A2I0X2L3_9ASPA|nr:hypothetical protein MA16_Dca004155 [Dendrobium catenatum]
MKLLSMGGGGPTLVSADGTPADETHLPRPSTSRGTQRLYIRINTLQYLYSYIFIDSANSYHSLYVGGVAGL